MSYAIRNSKSGLEKTFESKQAIANFFHEEGHDASEWEGHQCLGPLPLPTVTEEYLDASQEVAETMEAPVETPDAPEEVAPAVTKSAAKKAA